ncbi:MAG: penicillin-binding protein 2 [bacterium]|nr:penicillin-binding protein 2 [bacterium]
MRIRFVFLLFVFLSLAIIGRLFYWQILRGEDLAIAADAQRWIEDRLLGRRGQLLASDGYPLVQNLPAFVLYADVRLLTEPPEDVAKKLVPLLASASAEARLTTLLSTPNAVWVKLTDKLSQETKKRIEESKIEGLFFERTETRTYPEASMAAHLLGFVGADEEGRDKGYYGVEGFYDRSLRGHEGFIRQEKDAKGVPILGGTYGVEMPEHGRNLSLNIDRAIQFTVESHLQKALDRYGAKAGSVVVMDPETGAVLAMASTPSFSPTDWQGFSSDRFANPLVAETYEPGSTLKTIIMAAALEAGVVKPETVCTHCDGSRSIGGFTIRTWNDVYHPNATMIDVLKFSDNVGMVFVGELLGIDRLWQAFSSFGFLESTGIDVEGETTSAIRPKDEWRPIDLATASFGQGVAITPIQMVQGFSVIANGGVLVRPQVVRTEPKRVRRVISEKTAKTLTQMLVEAVDAGEAKWTRLPGYRIAGKTGTAQIPIAGHYDEEKTIASFIGFAPADKPKFVMLVTLKEPSSSPWASETAAPLFFDIAKDLLTYYGVPPEEGR